MTPAEILKAARAKIEDPKHWCQGEYARDQGPDSAWCAEGSLFSIAGENDEGAEDAAYLVLRRAAEEFAPHSLNPKDQRVIDVNDFFDHPTVMRMFSRAIELAEAES